MATTSTTVGRYLLDRIADLGVHSIFGVPGDFNLGFLDLVEDHPALHWVGDCNELNAAYAADGYARIRGTIGVLVTTFGVGELSAINGVAGAFSEMVPVLHIVGVPSTKLQHDRPMIHHTLGDGRYDAYRRAAEQFTIAQAAIDDVQNAQREIDRVITECITKCRPVYLTLPTDIVYQHVPPTLSPYPPLALAAPPNDPAAEAAVLAAVRPLLDAAQGNVVFLIDACAVRHDVRAEVRAAIERAGVPVYAAPMGKTAVDEDYERYGGIYVGSISHPQVREAVEGAKLIISVGALKTDFNTGHFTYSIPTLSTVELHSDHTVVQYARFPGVGMKHLLPQLATLLAPLAAVTPVRAPQWAAPTPAPQAAGVVRQSWFWPRVGEWFRPGDVIVVETGTSSFGILDVRLPAGATFVSQILWGSIGWAVGSTLGAALAAREGARDAGAPGRRVVLFVGDGSLQLTVQELSPMIRAGLSAVVFVLNNSGYTIERHLHGPERLYNDIAEWDWPALLPVLSRSHPHRSRSYTTRTEPELSSLLEDPAFVKLAEPAPGGEGVVQLVEVVMDRMDAPASLVNEAGLSKSANKYAGDQ